MQTTLQNIGWSSKANEDKPDRTIVNGTYHIVSYFFPFVYELLVFPHDSHALTNGIRSMSRVTSFRLSVCLYIYSSTRLYVRPFRKLTFAIFLFSFAYYISYIIDVIIICLGVLLVYKYSLYQYNIFYFLFLFAVDDFYKLTNVSNF